MSLINAFSRLQGTAEDRKLHIIMRPIIEQPRPAQNAAHKQGLRSCGGRALCPCRPMDSRGQPPACHDGSSTVRHCACP